MAKPTKIYTSFSPSSPSSEEELCPRALPITTQESVFKKGNEPFSSKLPSEDTVSANHGNNFVLSPYAYLNHVKNEAKSFKSVLRCSNYHPDPQFTPTTTLKMNPNSYVSFYKLSTTQEKCILENFAKCCEKLASHREEFVSNIATLPSANKIPCISDKSDWMHFLGFSKKFSEVGNGEHDHKMNVHPANPLLTYILQIRNNTEACQIISYFRTEISDEDKAFTQFMGSWLFSLLSAITLPPMPTSLDEIRSLGKSLLKAAEQVFHGDSDISEIMNVKKDHLDTISAINTLLCIISKAFGQKDLILSYGT